MDHETETAFNNVVDILSNIININKNFTVDHGPLVCNDCLGRINKLHKEMTKLLNDPEGDHGISHYKCDGECGDIDNENLGER